MKFSSTYFKRASDNLSINPKQEKIKNKVLEKTEENTKEANLHKKFKKKHGRSSSEIDYDKVLKDGKLSGGSSIYDLINNRLTDHTQITQQINTNENCAITIQTEIDEELARDRLQKKFSLSPLEIINFLPNNNLDKNLKDQHIYRDDEAKKSLTQRDNKSQDDGLKLYINEKEKNNSQQENIFGHSRSKSLQITPPVFKDESPYYKNGGETMQVMYSPSSNKEIKQLNQEQQLENLDRSVINCLICFDKVPDAVFMECGHGGSNKLFILSIIYVK